MSEAYALLLATAIVLATVLLAGAGLLSRAPVLLHNAAWAVALYIVGSGLIEYTTLGFRAWAFITAVIGAYNVGALLPALASPSAQRARSSLGPPPLQPLVTRRGFYALTAAYGLGIMVYLSSIARTYGLGMLLSDPERIRAGGTYISEGLPLPARSLFYLGPLVFVIAVNPWLAKPSLNRTERALVIAFVALSLTATLQRTNLFYALLWAAGLAVVMPSTATTWLAPTHRRSRGRRAARATAAALVALVAFQVLASALNKTTTAQPTIQAALAPPIRNAWGGLFIYSSGGVPALGQLYESENRDALPVRANGRPVYGDYNPQLWGRMTLTPILKVIPLAQPVDPVSPFIGVPFPNNTFTWVEPYYRDFREPGAIVIIFLSGVTFAWLVSKRSRGPHWLLIGALLVGGTVLAPFTNRLFTTFTMEMLVLVPLLALRRPRGAPRLPHARTDLIPQRTWRVERYAAGRTSSR